MVRARLRRESEQAADDVVLTQGVDAATCAAHLVELAREVQRHRRTWLPAPALARPSHLERRVSTMLNPRTDRRPMTRPGRFCSLGVLTTEVAPAAGSATHTAPAGARLLWLAGNAATMGSS